MGIEKGRNENLEEVIEFADRNGVYIVAAHSNRDVISYPASLKTVIGVRASKIYFKIVHCLNIEKVTMILFFRIVILILNN